MYVPKQPITSAKDSTNLLGIETLQDTQDSYDYGVVRTLKDC